MTEPADGTEQKAEATRLDLPKAAQDAAERRIEDAILRARLAAIWERAWPKLVPILCLVAIFLAVSWLGLWSLLPPVPRFILIGLFGLGLLGLLVPLIRIRDVTRAEALSRVSAASGVPHRPASAFSDRLSQATADPLTEALWHAHRLSLLRGLTRLRAGRPDPGMPARDPYALRFAIPLLLLVSFMAADGERFDRVADAFRLAPSVPEAPPRIDAWVTPPAYTGRPPIFLTADAARRAGDPNRAEPVPEGSIVTIRMPGGYDLAAQAAAENGQSLAFTTPSAPGAPPKPAGPASVAPASVDANVAPPLEQTLQLTSNAHVAISQRGKDLMAWNFQVIPDQPPQIASTRDPSSTASGSLSIAYSLEDDYGVVSARATLAPIVKSSGANAHPLFDAPDLPLSMPQLQTRNGTGETIRDLSSHPWAGARVRMTLTATDGAGQTGSSAPVDFVLPSRHFNNPIARALVEQRRILALDANQRREVEFALDAITLDPTKFSRDGSYLAIHAAYRRLVNARTDADLVSVVDFLWDIALGLEDNGMSKAAQDLRAAQEALRKAIENNASDEELQKAMQDLRAAMDQYMQSMAEQARRNPQSNQAVNPNAQTVTPQDLKKMLDQIENLARTGSKDAAKQMLSELQQMMDNMQTAQQDQQGSPQQGDAMNQSLDKLGDMIRRQQELMDKTFKLNPDTDGSGAQDPMTPDQRRQALQQLQQGQQQLQQQLQDLQQQMQQQGIQPNGKLGQAGRSMGEAQRQLGQGMQQGALGSQGQALQGLREGARSMTEQMARQGRTGTRANGNQQGQDPLGRQQQGRGPDLGTSVKVPDAIDTQRARELLDTIRRRLGEAARPLIERDYLERLLQQ